MRELGIDLPDAALTWITKQTERLWQLRGPVPGLAAALSYLGVERPHVAARSILEATGEADPWVLLEEGFADRSRLPDAVAAHLAATIVRIWQKLQEDQRQALRLLSAFDITSTQVTTLMYGHTDVELTLPDLLANPYFAATCTYAQPEHVPFSTVDRACFPPTHVTWAPSLPPSARMDGNLDRRRIEALLTDVLEAQGALGDTLLPEPEAIELANAIVLTRAPNVTPAILGGLDLDSDSLRDWNEWSPLTGVRLADGGPALKLSRYEIVSALIREWITGQESRPRLNALSGARGILDAALDRNKNVDTSQPLDQLEGDARTEKAAGLSALHDAPLAVLIGPAGTGKTTLLKALVDLPGVADGGVLLLAPTGKARVQMETEVERPAKTLASYLTPSDRYDGETGRYLVWGDLRPRQSFGLVVIDEASMLTEEMLAATLDAFANVKRLILVGDPRQLPPIGPGRPFVDLVHELRPDAFASHVHVAPGYVELQIPRRQLPDGTHGRRADLELASWFGDGIRGAGDEAIWNDLITTSDLGTVRYESWGKRSVSDALIETMASELPLDADSDEARAFALTYGGTISGPYLNWEIGAGESAEEWQILSPTRSRAYGTVELNRHMKRKYRANDTNLAQRNLRSNVASPLGPELIVRGDKVMQTTNRRLTAWPAGSGPDYVANGEIGVAIGRLVPSAKRKKKSLQLNVEFSSQRGASYSYWPTSGDNNVMLELAWAVTVHKSQGSEFGTTFVVLPARTNVFRELMYTALTRQKDKVVILHEGTLEALRDLAQPWRSETARRLTDLFAASEPVILVMRGTARRFGRRLMHVAANGVPMASKNEVIIAGLLDRLVPGQWHYELVLEGSDGRKVKPDFTVLLPDGRIVFWEHAGMLDLPDYAAKWALKKQWYAENGILPHEAGGGPQGCLMWTDDLAGADAQQWLQLASDVLGVVPAAPPAAGPPGGPPPRRVAKKAAPRGTTPEGKDD